VGTSCGQTCATFAKLTEKRSIDADQPTVMATGVATDEGKIVGTIACMSPEQAQGLKGRYPVGHLQLRACRTWQTSRRNATVFIVSGQAARFCAG
jgi:hypothetical protein